MLVNLSQSAETTVLCECVGCGAVVSEFAVYATPGGARVVFCIPCDADDAAALPAARVPNGWDVA